MVQARKFSFSVYVSVIRRMEVGRYKVTGLIYLPVYMDALARLLKCYKNNREKKIEKLSTKFHIIVLEKVSKP